MPGLLKSFELHGYKTFASRTEFQFADGITAIVGPNGSGKSNVADALRWVLGEQSFGLLRAKKTEDMIFAGSEHRPRAGMASATIIFDNSGGWLPIDFSEVGITRRAYRDGDNEYLLNGQRVRLKDVSELLAQSGLAERTYTVIGQGLVDAALSLKAEERRRLFEEAAGIGLHRARRDEALRRLDTTRRNLERVEDILAELQPRLRSLERQARRTQEYEQVRKDLKILLREWYGYHWHQAQAELTEAMSASRHQEGILEKVRAEQANLDKELDVIRRQSQDLRDRIREWNLKLSVAYGQREQVAREQAVTDERLRSLEVQTRLNETEILSLQEEIKFYQEQSSSTANDITHLEDEQNDAKRKLAEAGQTLDERRKQIEFAENEFQEIQTALSALNTRQSVLQTQCGERRATIERREVNLEEIKKDLAKAEHELQSLQASLLRAIERRQKDDQLIADTNLVVQANRDEISSLETLRRERLESLNNAQAKLTELRIQLDILRQAEESLSGYADGARLLLQALKASQITGARGALSNYLEVPEKYENAIASVLGDYLGAVLVNGWDGVEDALKILEDGTARGVLLVLEALSPPKPLIIDIAKSPVEKDMIIGIASDLVEVHGELRQAVDVLLGQVVIVRDRKTARRLLSSGNWATMPMLRIVTEKGEVFHSSGSVISAGGGKGVLSRPRELKELEAQIGRSEKLLVDIRASVNDVNDRLSKALDKEKELARGYIKVIDAQKESSGEVSKLELSVEKARGAKTWQQEQVLRVTEEIQQTKLVELDLQNDIRAIVDEIKKSRTILHEKMAQYETLSLDDIQGEVSYWQTQTAVIERALRDIVQHQQERQDTLIRATNSAQALHIRMNGTHEEMATLRDRKENLIAQLSRIGQEIEEVRGLVLPAEAELEQVEKRLNQFISTDMTGRQNLSAAEHQYAQARINLSRRQESLDSLQRRIEDDFGLVAFEYADAVSGPKPLPLNGMVEELPKIEQISHDLEENVQRQRALLRRMGPVNPDAQSEYQQVKERFEFLTNQVTDLHKAENDIREVIAELDLLMEREFRKTFDAVAQEFRHIFTRLFGGGMAKLVLTDPEDMTGTGIDIEAKLPGRREQGLSLLSGGERSLTAAALVFALLKISPTPFCILDEVDAMLDEANVGRFRELLLELSAHTQFIVITHNRNTVQAASVIYGVTMGRDSASQVISLKLDELTEEYGVQRG